MPFTDGTDPRGDAAAGGGKDSGSAVVDFIMVGALLTVVFVAVIQLALILHVRNTLIDAAGSGARYGALADRTPADGVDRTKVLIGAALGDRFAEDVSYAQRGAGTSTMLEITVKAPLPVIGFLGPSGGMEVRGHAVWLQEAGPTGAP